MSDKPIKAGDLVMVVRARSCCGATEGMGYVFIVGDIYHGPVGCGYCRIQKVGALAREAGHFNGAGVYRLLRIDPPAQGDALSESTRTGEELTA
jgi:hypothetical protein